MKNNEKKQNDLQKSTENTEELEQLEMLDGVYGNENEKPETPPQTKFTAEEKRKKALLEFRDLLAGAAFPLMLMMILSATIFSFIGMVGKEDVGLKILILIVGEALLIAAYVIFGRQNGVTSYKKKIANTNKRKLNSSDLRSKLYVGEYALVKGILTALISCVPMVIILIIESAYHNQVCEFIMMYVFGWAYYPFKMLNLPVILNLVWIVPLTAVHTAAYVWGANKEKKRQEIIAKAEESKAKRKKK
ncbi:MAG: hypothetical protein HFE40_00690 [Clostridia bacterium]|nr:hypothetical protein [Clostridia bacterium]